jgi:hypothetical protein
MNDQPMNGQPPPLSPEATAAINAQLQQIEAMVRVAVSVTLRGIVASAQNVPPQIVLSGLAWQVGNQMAEALSGDLSAMLILRKGFIEAFTDGVQKAKLIQPPAAGAVPPNLRAGT